MSDPRNSRDIGRCPDCGAETFIDLGRRWCLNPEHPVTEAPPEISQSQIVSTVRGHTHVSRPYPISQLAHDIANLRPELLDSWALRAEESKGVGTSAYDLALQALEPLTTSQLKERAHKSDRRLTYGRRGPEKSHEELVELLAGVVSMIVDGPLPPGVEPGGMVRDAMESAIQAIAEGEADTPDPLEENSVVEDIREGLEQARRGELIPGEEVRERIRRKSGDRGTDE